MTPCRAGAINPPIGVNGDPDQCEKAPGTGPPRGATDCVQGCDVDGVYAGSPSTCDLTCQPGYASPTGSSHYACATDGTWKPPAGSPYQCSGKQCEVESLPSGGGLTALDYAEINDHHYPSVVTFDCPGGQHPADKQADGNAPNRWECSNTTLNYQPEDGSPTLAADLVCKGCDEIRNCPKPNLICDKYDGECTQHQSVCTKWKKWKCTESHIECKAYKTLYDQRCNQCDEGYAVIEGARPEHQQHTRDICFGFTSLRPSTCTDHACVQKRYLPNPGDSLDECVAEKGCQLAVDGAQNSFQLDLHSSWIGTAAAPKSVTISVVRYCPDAANVADGALYWQRHDTPGCPTSSTTGADDHVSITLPSGWNSDPGIGSVTFSAATGISPTGTIQLNFKRPGLFRLTVTANGKEYTESAVTLDVGPGRVSSGEEGVSTWQLGVRQNSLFSQLITLDHRSWWSGSGDVSIGDSDMTFQEGFEYVVNVAAQAQDAQGNKRVGRDEMRIQISTAEGLHATWATVGLLGEHVHASESVVCVAGTCSLPYGSHTGSYTFASNATKDESGYFNYSGVLTVSVWFCDASQKPDCEGDVMIKGPQTFTVCPQNTVYTGPDIDQHTPGDWFNQIIEGDHLESCQCMPGFYSSTGSGTACKPCASGKRGSQNFGGNKDICVGCTAGTYCGCESESAQVLKDTCISKGGAWQPACVGAKKNNGDPKGACDVCKQDSYQNQEEQSVCWQCRTGFQCFEGSTYPIAKKGYWVSPTLTSTFVKPPETLDCTLDGEGTPTSPCKKCSGRFNETACPGSSLTYDKRREPRPFVMPTDPELKRCITQPAPLSPTTGEQSFGDRDVCQAVIGSKLSDGYKFKVTASSSQVPAACCSSHDREGSCHTGYYEVDTKNEHEQPIVTCDECSKDDNSSTWGFLLYAWHTVWGLDIRIRLLMFATIPVFVILAVYLQHMSDVTALLHIITNFLQTYSLVHGLVGQGSTTTDSNTFPKGLLPTCPGSPFNHPDLRFLSPDTIRCFVSDVITWVAPTANFDFAGKLKAMANKDVQCKLGDTPYDLKYYLVMVSPIVAVFILVIFGWFPIMLFSVSAQWFEQNIGWTCKAEDWDEKEKKYKRPLDRLKSHWKTTTELRSKDNQWWLESLEFNPRVHRCGSGQRCSLCRVVGLFVCCLVIFVVVAVFLIISWLYYFVTLGGGEWSEHERMKPRSLRQAWPGQVVAALLTSFYVSFGWYLVSGGWGYLMGTSPAPTSYWFLMLTILSGGVQFLAQHYKYVSLRPDKRADGRHLGGCGAEYIIEVAASIDAKSVKTTVFGFIVYYMGSLGYIFIMKWAVAPLFCDDTSGTMILEPTVECTSCVSEADSGLHFSFAYLWGWAVVATSLYGLGLPAAFALKLYEAKQKGVLRHAAFESYFGFLTAKMKDQRPCYMWGVFELVQKLLLVLATVLYGQVENLVTYLLSTLVVILVACGLQIHYLPFAENDANFIQVFCSVSLILTIVAALGRKTTPPKLDATGMPEEENDALDKFILVCAYFKTFTLLCAGWCVIGRGSRGVWKKDHVEKRETEQRERETEQRDRINRSGVAIEEPLLVGQQASDASAGSINVTRPPSPVGQGGMGVSRPPSPPGQPEPEPEVEAGSNGNDDTTLADFELDMLDKGKTMVAKAWVETERDPERRKKHHEILKKFSEYCLKFEHMSGQPAGPRWKKDELYDDLVEFESTFRAELRPHLHAWMQEIDQSDRNALNGMVDDFRSVEEQQSIYLLQRTFHCCYGRCSKSCQTQTRNRLQDASWVPTCCQRRLKMLSNQMELTEHGRRPPATRLRGLVKKATPPGGVRLSSVHNALSVETPEEPRMCTTLAGGCCKRTEKWILPAFLSEKWYCCKRTSLQFHKGISAHQMIFFVVSLLFIVPGLFVTVLTPSEKCCTDRPAAFLADIGQLHLNATVAQAQCADGQMSKFCTVICEEGYTGSVSFQCKDASGDSVAWQATSSSSKCTPY
eukprot:COSAG06_NODE_160_length_21658_cov_6.433462_5_plen_1986_part_00